MDSFDKRIEKVARVHAAVAYSTFTKFQHAGANKTRLVKILRDNIKQAMKQVRYHLDLRED